VSRHDLKKPQVWKHHDPVGKFAMVQGMGGVVAPLLAGFSLATIAVLVTTGWLNASKPSSDGPPHADLAVAALAVAATSFLLTMEFTFIASRYATTPAERMDWTPEAALDRDVLQAARVAQAMDRVLADSFAYRARWLYNGGLMFFLAGLGVIAVPQRWTPPLVVAVSVAFLALIFEVWAVLLKWPRRWHAAIFPAYRQVRARISPTVDALDEVSRRSVMRPEPDE